MNTVFEWIKKAGERTVFYLRFLYLMTYVEFLSIKGRFILRVVSSLIPLVFQALVLIFILPVLGISAEYTKLVVMSRLFISDAISSSASLLSGLGTVGDLEQALMAPVPWWLVLLGRMFGFALRMFSMTVILIPFVVVFLKGKFVFSILSIVLLMFSLVLIQFFDAVMGLWGASYTKKMSEIVRVWARVINPMSFIATFSPKWPMIISSYPVGGWLLLANPFLYVHEMGRSAVFGSSGFIPPVICALMLVVFSLIFAFFGLRRLKRRFDLV
ncbi:hypothetical protein ACFLY6_01020 [Candidatus Dependentiae bacterium]